MDNRDELLDLTKEDSEKRDVFENIPPPIRPKLEKLPFKRLTWKRFQGLGLLISKKDRSLTDQKIYGIEGQSQEGIDIRATIKDTSRLWVCQAKRYKKLEPQELEDFVEEFLNGSLVSKTSTYVFATSVDLSDKKLIERIDSIREELDKRNIKFITWGSIEINDILKNQYDIVLNFFGDVWANDFCINIPKKKDDIIQNVLFEVIKKRASQWVFLKEKTIYKEHEAKYISLFLSIFIPSFIPLIFRPFNFYLFIFTVLINFTIFLIIGSLDQKKIYNRIEFDYDKQKYNEGFLGLVSFFIILPISILVFFSYIGWFDDFVYILIYIVSSITVFVISYSISKLILNYFKNKGIN